jgi:hypothetical protein
MPGQNRKEVIEVLGGIAVVASLVFVGFEIRQNTIAARASAYQSIGVASAEVFNSSAHDLRYLETLQKQPEDLTDIEWAQLIAKQTVYARLGETTLLQVEQGLLPEDAMERLGLGGWKSTAWEQWMVCAWREVRRGTSDAFRDYVEESQDFTNVDCSKFPKISFY